ncbi:MAG: glycosyltransferase family 1 protein, partial [Bacteroidota bacterium]
MKILILHNKYLQKGGEDTVVAAEKALLEERGNEVRVLMFDNAVIKGGIKGIKSLFQSVYNREAYDRVLAEIEDFQPAVMHVHNTFYVASHAIYHAAKDAELPVIQTLHNYRLVCPSAFLFHKGNIYTKSVNKVFPLDA